MVNGRMAPAAIRAAHPSSELPMTAVIATHADRPAALWRDRTTHWSIALGPLRIARTTTQVRYIGPIAQAERSAPAGRGVLMWGFALLILAGCLSWGFGAKASVQRPRFVTPIIDIVVPAPARPEATAPPPVEPDPAAFRPKAAVAETADSALADARNFDRFPAVRRAVEAAFRTGDAQDWVEGDYQGLVVAGAPYAEGRRTCRETAILLRDGGFEGTTKSTITCHATADGGEG
jgi:hypothetical protein